MPAPPELRAAFTPVHTERLLLRAVSDGDVGASFVIHSDPATYRFHPGGAIRTRAQAAAQLADWQREWRDLGFGIWAVSLAAEERVIGFGGLTRRVFRGHPVLNTYYRFAPSAWGHGYATEMARGALELARRLLPEMPMIVRTRPGNVAAQSVAEKLGLRRAPDLEDHMWTYVSRWDGDADDGSTPGGPLSLQV